MAARSRLLPLALALPAAATVLAGCGGGSDKSATQLIDTAFRQPIKSADVSFNLQVQVNGVAALTTPITVTLGGPYVNNGPGKLPSLDFNANISGGGQSVPFGLTSTGNDFFVKVRGQAYDVGRQTVARLNRQLARQQSRGQRTSLSELGIHPLGWLSHAKTAGDATIAGTPVKHISASLDVGKLLDDLNQLVTKAPTSGIPAAKPPQLSDQQKSQIEHAIQNPKIDVYVAKGDHTVRRLASTLVISLPKDQRARFNGATGGTLQLSIQFANVGQPKTIRPPSGAKPISTLAGQINALGGSLGAGSAGGSSSSGSGGASGSPPGTPTAKQFEDYAKCIQRAGSNNPSALQKCADTLK